MDNNRKICLVCKKHFEGAQAALENCPTDDSKLVQLMADPLVGTIFAEKYDILSVLGSGGMSIIYKAQHRYMERVVAIKLLHPFLVQDPLMLQRFQYEAKAASNLSHPNVVTTHDFGITGDGRAYLVMDYLEGEDLGKLLEREHVLPEAEALKIFQQTMCGLAHAHSKSVIHRDLKPSNIFLVKSNEGIFIKLVDFGIAKINDQTKPLTGSGEVFGSPLYMSPEQCMGKPLDARSDIYSLGCLMYEVLAGKRPLVGETSMETMQLHLSKNPVPLSKAAPKLTFSKNIEKAVMKCLEKKPDHRYKNVDELYQEIYGERLPWAVVVSDNNIEGSAADKNMPVHSLAGRAVDADFSHYASGQHIPGGTKAGSKPRTLAIATLLICTPGLFWLICIWPGPDHDQGTLLNRWSYTFWMWRGEDATRKGRFIEAEADLNNAQAQASSFQDNFGRLSNVLRAKLALYTSANAYQKREATIATLTGLTARRAQSDFALAMKELNAIETLRSKLDPGQASLTQERELELRMRTAIAAIMDVSKRLSATGALDDQETMLSRAVNLYSHFVGDDDPLLAGLVTELAYCHLKQDEFMEARPLLAQALKITRQAARHQAASDLDIAEACMRLGQFDRDRSAFSEAESELSEALKILRPYKKLDRASQESVRGYKLLTECLNGLADYKVQVNDNAAADRFRDEANELKKQKIDYHP